MEKYKTRYVGALEDQIKWGGNDDPRPLLHIGQIVTVLREEVHSQHTKVVLEELPNFKFNNVSFEKIEEGETE
jgi:hypothetical protein